MYLLLVFLPLISFCSVGLFGRHFGAKGSSLLSTICLFVSFAISLIIFYEVAIIDCIVTIKLANWINSDILVVNWGFLFDSLTVLMCVIVTFISCLVHFYSIEYMSNDPHLPRFMSYLSLFTFFMLILVTADNFVQMFVGWEGVGLCSYLLINFWFTRIQANKAAIKAMILNRIGDFSLLIGIVNIFLFYWAVDYSTVFALTPFMQDKVVWFIFGLKVHYLTIVCLFLFIGCMGKSAQLGLHTWLPDAMEGPTPVSALIHAATMVTAGIFLLARCSSLFEYQNLVSFSNFSNEILNINVWNMIIVIGSLTAFFASTIGLAQNDLKKIIAYSTCSQLGYMIFACGLSGYSASLFHLSNHAFFKALLFLTAGSVIHSLNDEQDIRKMGGLKHLLPFTYSAMSIGSLALIGFPFLSGFYSKDLILEIAFSKYSLLGYYSYTLGTCGAFFTSFYSARALYLAFIAKPLGYKVVICYAKESGVPMTLVLSCLSVLSVFIGYFSKDILVGFGSLFFGGSLTICINNFNQFEAEFLLHFYKILPVYFSLLGFFISFFLYNTSLKLLFKLKKTKIGKKLYIFLNRKWFFDKLYNEYFGQYFFEFGYSVSYKILDRGIFEVLGPTGLSAIVLGISKRVQKLNSGAIYHYMLVILGFITVIFLIREIFIIFHFFSCMRWIDCSVIILVTLVFLTEDPLKPKKIKKFSHKWLTF